MLGTISTTKRTIDPGSLFLCWVRESHLEAGNPGVGCSGPHAVPSWLLGGTERAAAVSRLGVDQAGGVCALADADRGLLVSFVAVWNSVPHESDFTGCWAGGYGN